MGIEPLDRADDAELALAAPQRDLKIEDRNVGGAGRRSAADDLSADDAAVDQLPGRPRIVSADGLAGHKQGGNRFAKLRDCLRYRTHIRRPDSQPPGRSSPGSRQAAQWRQRTMPRDANMSRRSLGTDPSTAC